MPVEYLLSAGLCRPGYTLGEPVEIRLGLVTVRRYENGVRAHYEAMLDQIEQQHEANKSAILKASQEITRRISFRVA